ncbi:MAG: calcium-binding protein [Planctomycetes bacterium]|nr:calcium-binding protein [Planctomycetota bacterium]
MTVTSGTGSNTIGDGNLFYYNTGSGIRFEGPSANANSAFQNRFWANGGPAIDAGTSGATLNDSGETDGVLDYAVITHASVDGSNLVITGFVGAGRAIEFYASAPSGSGFGQGSVFLATRVEGTTEDLDTGTGSYGPVVNGRTVSTASVSADRFRFEIPLPAGVADGTLITATALGSTSEFAPPVVVGEQASQLAPEVTLDTTSVTLVAGGRLEISGSFYDPDSTTWTATVDYGDGGGWHALSLGANHAFELSYVYSTAGNRTVRVRVIDNSLTTGEATATVTVENEAPEVTFNEFTLTSPVNEGQTVVLTGQFLDSGDTHTVDIAWGDGTSDHFPVPGGERSFTAYHVYGDDSNTAGSATSSDVYRVAVTVTDDAGAGASTPAGLFLAEVRNVRPSGLAVDFSGTTLVEGDTLTISGAFMDPSDGDLHTVRIDWGDGSNETFGITRGSRTFAGLTHTYTDNPTDGSGDFFVTVELWDDDEPLQPERFMRTVRVENAVPEHVVVEVTPDRLTEGSSVSVSGGFDDAGVHDAHTVRIDWGDGSALTILALPAGVHEFQDVPHEYEDNPGTIGDPYFVTVEVSDRDDPGVSGRVALPVYVANAIPRIMDLFASSGSGPIDEGGTLTISGQYADASPTDTHEVLVDWGDGETTWATIDSATRSFTASHRYIDNGDGPDESYSIAARLFDDDGDTHVVMVGQTVRNVAPAVGMVPGPINTDPNFIALQADVTDAGRADTHGFSWIAYPLVDPPVPPQFGSAPSFVVDRSLHPTALWHVELSVADNDGGVAVIATTMLAGTAGDDTIVVDDATVAGSGTSTFLILGLDGADVIDATAVTDPSVSIILDGGAGQDYLFGGSGDDVYYLRRGDDVANATGVSGGGPNPSTMPATLNLRGDDRYVLVPNSTLTVFDTDGANILDFTFADFGDGSGITLDLNAVSNTSFSLQDVSVTQPGAHYVQLMGGFSKLYGSAYGDRFTAASGATLEGGAGDDQFDVGSDITGARVFGGADDDVLTVTGTGIGDLVFQGDDGADHVFNDATVFGFVFRGGADDDILINTGWVDGTLSFGGDDGMDQLINEGTFANLVFTGGADDDFLVNSDVGTVTGTLSFGGDDGMDQLINEGTFANLVFTGGADDDFLGNLGGIDTIVFSGDDGLDRFENSGSVGEIMFTGGADDDFLVNSDVGTVTGTLSFGGDDGTDQLINQGTALHITFSGGADDDWLLNTGEVIGTLVFGGDDGLDQLVNQGTLADIRFGGGADDDLLMNAGEVIGTLVFGGDDGVDRLTNQGTSFDIQFRGGADDDLLLNLGSITGSLSFGGDDGADVLRNEGYIDNLAFSGGADDDLLVNSSRSSIAGLSFGGDDGADSVHNLGLIDVLTFTGGADDDWLINAGSVATTLTFSGDDGADRMLNEGTVAALTFQGGADDDVLQNAGTVGELAFQGGADDDVLVNSGNITTSLGFTGDDGADLLRNEGTIGGLTYTGGADDDLLVNLGGVTTSLDFTGDDGADELWNLGSAESIGFAGGADDDLLVNQAPNIAVIVFGGGADDDILWNAGANVGSIEFGGGADDDVLQNTGASIGSITFRGDDGLDALINLGDSVGQLAFAGGGDDDVLANYGRSIGSIDFGGDSGNDTLIVRGSGSATGLVDSYIHFRGDDGIDAFQNNASGFAGIVFEGGADDDVFQNNVSGIGEILFEGGADDDLLENNGDGVTNLVFVGDEGFDILINDGRAVVGLEFEGGADDDVLINTGTAVAGVVFTGDDGSDALINSGARLSGVTFMGGGDDDALLNSGPLSTDLLFLGDAGDDLFRNRPEAVESGRLTFFGDDGSDTLVNEAGGVFGVEFDGGADDDALFNAGIQVVGLTFNGGADDDTLTNSGARADAIDFTGDDGDDLLVNRGLDVLWIGFQGDDGADTFLNTGSALEIEFHGGSDDDTLLNEGPNVGGLVFNGDDGSDLLVNNGPVLAIAFQGGADDDVLQNNATAGSITFGGGADDDALINNGQGVGSIDFGGDDGNDTLLHNADALGFLTFTGGADHDTLRVHGEQLGNMSFEGGSGADAFHFNGVAVPGTVVTFLGGDDDDLLAWRGAADELDFQGDSGNDTAIVVGSGSLRLAGGDGDDTTYFQSHPAADVTIEEWYGGDATDLSGDTLDFSGYSGGPLRLDLRVTTRQVQSVQFAITILDGMGVENVIGSMFGDTLDGNPRNNLIHGAEYAGGFTGPVADPRGATQWALLDFDTHTDPGEHVYSQEERVAIADRIESVFRGPDAGSPWFDVRVVLDAAEIPSGTDHATLRFNETPESGRPGGLASEVDPGNRNLGGWAAIQVNGLLGGVIVQADIAEEGHVEGNAYKGDRSPVGDEQIGATKPGATRENFVLLSAKIGAHELAHLLGLRHSDSFGPIGFGLHDPPGAGAYKPFYTGPVGGVETFDHLIGSPASIGSDRFNDLNDLFFGEREAVKLAWANSNPAQTTFPETTDSHRGPETAQAIGLVTLSVPNTLRRGLNESKNFFVQLASIDGRIDGDAVSGASEEDWYAFSGRSGELVNIDVLSNSIARFGTSPDDYVDTVVRLWYDTGSGIELVPYYSSFAENDDIFEPTDSALIDLRLPLDATYYIEVDTFSRDPSDPLFDPANPLSPLNPDNPFNILNHPDLLKRFLDTRDDTDTGNYQLVVYRFDKANAEDGVDVIKGNGGTDEVDGGPGDAYALEYELGAPATTLEGALFSRTIVIDDRAASDWIGSEVDYGDGSGTRALEVDPGGVFELAHAFGDDGVYTITVTIRDDIGQSLTRALEVVVANVAPDVSLTGPEDAEVGEMVTVYSTVNDPAGAADPLTWTWEITRDGSPFESRTGGGEYALSPTLAGSYVVRLTVDDGDGGVTSASHTVRVTSAQTNHPPVVTVGGPSDSIRGLAATFAFVATDPDAVDQDGSFTWVVDWGDGTASETRVGSSTIAWDHAFDGATAETFAVTVRATDSRGLTSEPAVHSLDMLLWDVQPDPLHPGDAVLIVGGSAQADRIRLTQHGSQRNGYHKLRIDTDIDGSCDDEAEDRYTVRIYDAFRRIVVYGRGGDDRIDIQDRIELPSLLDGGDGNDRIRAGSGDNIVLGGAGDDRILGQQGRDLLIGGSGSDEIRGGTGEDILIAGYTALDTNREALDAVMREWTGRRSFEQRRDRISGRTSGGLNGFWNLRASGTGRNVFDDGVADRLWGNSGRDWFLLDMNNTDRDRRDRIMDWHKSDEDDDIDG